MPEGKHGTFGSTYCSRLICGRDAMAGRYGILPSGGSTTRLLPPLSSSVIGCSSMLSVAEASPRQ
jgi:hypothetical protein